MPRDVGIDDDRGMFMVTFRDEHNNNDLASLILPAIPNVGEPVYIREQAHHRSRTGRVVSRHWHILTKEPENSDVILMLRMD